MVDVWLQSVVLLVTGPSFCTGVVVEQEVVATAYHCVATGMAPRVELRDGAVFRGRTIAADPDRDLALVRVQGLAVAPLPLVDATPPVGTRVYGLGHPFAVAAAGRLAGTLRWSVTEGIVSAVGAWYVQTDAALNPGNSGGPVVDAEGRIVGIASRKLNADNLSFLAPASALAALMASRRAPSLAGGTWEVSAAVVADRTTALGPQLEVSFRERIVADAFVGVTLVDEVDVAAMGLLFLRQRIGDGPLSTAIDLGGGGRWMGKAEPLLAGRLGAAGFSFGMTLVPGEWTWGIVAGLEVPGGRGVF